MSAPSKTKSAKAAGAQRKVEFAGDVLQQIRQHARSSMQAEICGVLIGEASDGLTRVTARIAGEGADQGGAHVTFTQDAWEHIYKIKDEEFPGLSIVGWYHSHPGFGIFLSDYDLFIHENFFTAPHQVAFVFDPHSDEEGCFGWAGEKVEPLDEIAVTRAHRAVTPEQAEEEAASRRDREAAAPHTAAGSKSAVNPASGFSQIEIGLVLTILGFAGGFLLRPYISQLAHAAAAFVSGSPQ
jgi:proteasome lid subunit RPN8/RPN11